MSNEDLTTSTIIKMHCRSITTISFNGISGYEIHILNPVPENNRA